MPVFRQWYRGAHRALSATHPRLRLGHVQEIMAAALGHKTYASLRVQDLAAIDRAAYAFIDIPAMVQRADDLGTLLDPKACRDVVRDMRMVQDDDGFARYVIVEENLPTFGLLLDKPLHPSGHELAREIDATFVGLTPLIAEPKSPLAQVGDSWSWRVRSTAHASKGEKYFEVSVYAEVLLPRIGRRLFADCFVVNLVRDGDWTEFDPNELETDYSYLSDSNL